MQCSVDLTPYLTEDAHRVPKEVEAAHDLVQLPQESADVVALQRVCELGGSNGGCRRASEREGRGGRGKHCRDTHER